MSTNPLPGYDEWLERPYYDEKPEKPERDPDYEREKQLERQFVTIPPDEPLTEDCFTHSVLISIESKWALIRKRSNALTRLTCRR